jgi:hypothetical protein
VVRVRSFQLVAHQHVPLLDAAISALEEIIARKTGERETVIEGEAEVVPSLATPKSTKAL